MEAGLAVNGASAITSEPVIVIEAVPGASSVTTTVMDLVPSSRKVWLALTVKSPAAAPATIVPGVVVPSPQSITAEKSVGVFVGKPVSLNVATGPLYAELSIVEPAGIAIAPLVKTSASVIVAVLPTVIENPGSLFSKKVVLTLKLPSSP